MPPEIRFAKPDNVTSISYGTAGFRMSYDGFPQRLEFILYRMGILSSLRSLYKKASVGLMVTASHNPECDNGVKLVDPHGEMLEPQWELLATKLVNCSNSEVEIEVKEIFTKYDISTEDGISSKSTVLIGRDTRRSSARLVEAAIAGIDSMKVKFLDAGILTTPQLHFLVRESNLRSLSDDYQNMYVNRFISDAFVKQLDKFRPSTYSSKLHIDCANGVGSIIAKRVSEIVRDSRLDIIVRNQWNPETATSDGPLNGNCGADYVKINIKAPQVYKGSGVGVGERWISFDGDADRIVYYYLTASQGEKSFQLLDGDRLATLYAVFLKNLLDQADLSQHLSIGLVQTAYANGSSTRYITDKLGLPVSCVPTGVKYLHAEAHAKFDIGIYFEANGHGTVTFSEKAHRIVENADSSENGDSSAALEHLRGIMALVNEAVGDAVTDFLLAEHILACNGWDLSTWASQYTDLPVCQLKVSVRDRSVVKTEDAERRCVSPRSLQASIDEIVSHIPSGRAFVRPSGTEDVVRVYAECEGTLQDARRLAVSVAEKVYELADGVGAKPI